MAEGKDLNKQSFQERTAEINHKSLVREEREETKA